MASSVSTPWIIWWLHGSGIHALLFWPSWGCWPHPHSLRWLTIEIVYITCDDIAWTMSLPSAVTGGLELDFGASIPLLWVKGAWLLSVSAVLSAGLFSGLFGFLNKGSPSLLPLGTQIWLLVAGAGQGKGLRISSLGVQTSSLVSTFSCHHLT